MADMMDDSKLPHHYPSFSVHEKQMPEIDDWDTEQTYRMIVDVVMTGKSARKGNPTRGDFEIVAYKVLKRKTINDMSDEEFGAYQGKALAAASKRNG